MSFCDNLMAEKYCVYHWFFMNGVVQVCETQKKHDMSE